MATTSSSPIAHRRGPPPKGVKPFKRKRSKTTVKKTTERSELVVDTMTISGRIAYRPAHAKAAKILCAVYGSTVHELAEFFRVDSNTITSWIKKRPDFREAVEDGAASANMTVMQRLYRQAVGFYYQGEKVFYDGRRGKVVRTTVREYVEPSETAQIFWLKNRMPDKWRDKHELSGPDGKKLAGDLYQLFNVTVSSDAAIDTYNKLLQVEARADVEFKDKGK